MKPIKIAIIHAFQVRTVRKSQKIVRAKTNPLVKDLAEEYIHCVAKVFAVLPFYDVKCLCSGGRDEGGRKATPTSTSIFDF